MELSGHIEPWPGAAAEQGASENEVSSSPSSAITAVFLQLLPRVARFMPRTSWILRLLCKSAAVTLRGPQHTKVHLSELAPPAEFQWRWCGPQSLRSTTLKQRRQLEELTARSGVVANLEALEEAHGGDLPLLSRPAAQWGPLLDAATGAGRLEACLWLHAQRGVPLSKSCLEGAAVGGHMDVCEWLLERGCEWKMDAVVAAARHGHVQLAEQLLQLRPQAASTDGDEWMLLAAAAHSCDLATLQRVHAEHVASRGLKLSGGFGVDCVAAAAGSPTPDWAAKVEWLEGLCHGCADPTTCFVAAGCKQGGAARLAWLHERGYPLRASHARAAAWACDAEALRFVLTHGVRVHARDFINLASVSASSGCLETLQVLWDAGCRPDARAVEAAAGGGHLHVVSWAAEQLGDGAVLTAYLFGAAARSGSLPLLRWLHERGCPWDAMAMAAAATAGSEEVLEWLHERGCPMGEDGAAYVEAAAKHDLPTLRCLARLGCPFAPDGSTFVRAAAELSRRPPFDSRPLQWLLDAGCPVDWDAALLREAGVQGAVREWLVQKRLQLM